jgi:hypothetical protein
MIRVISNISIRQLSSEELTFDLLFQMEANERDSEEFILLDQLKEARHEESDDKKSDDETLFDDNISETESQKEERGSMDSIDYFVNLQKTKKKNQSLQEAESIRTEGSSPEPKKTCPGCSPVFQPNQLAHMCEGGCLSDF